MAWIRTIDPDDARGALHEEYEKAQRRAGRVAKVVQLSSLNPEVLTRWVEIYKQVMFGPSPLSRAERELVATVVSQENGCYY